MANHDTALAKRVLLVCQADGFANGVRPAGLEGVVRAHGHDLDVVNTYYLSRASKNSTSVLRKLPRPGLRRLALYGVEAAWALFTRKWKFGRTHFSYPLLLADYELRRSLLASILTLNDYDAVICAHPHDAGLLTVPTRALTFYDCPNPWADEMWFEGRLTPTQHRKLRRFEIELYQAVDALSFSWESYGRYAVEHYGVSGENFVQLNWGCTPSATRAKFAAPPRVVYIGSLTSRFIDLQLLSRLSKVYPHIDVYGGPPPDPTLGLNYCGWAPPTVLADYQFGLITCTKDELRRDGFSAKHLDYIAYGLPVLVPVWRRHLDLLRGSVPYDESNFVKVIDSLSDEESWQAASDTSYAQAELLTWHRTVEPLMDLLVKPG